MILSERINNMKKENLLTELKSNEKKIIRLKKEKLDGIIIRSGSNWIENSERSNKIFFGLLKSREKKKMINGLYNSKNELITNNDEIRKVVYIFYESLFKKGTTEDKC
ncbi:hypothetical protein AYI70_g8654 [Smittium culicis]|uniref:Uncharacterized protein n=1 Tax=Smittium culicis TaxID=133412 RepID=A0A1R1XEZ1_9FUNG|nr:hypothetical protein AYI70_g8654 [Smittium culicis]